MKTYQHTYRFADGTSFVYTQELGYSRGYEKKILGFFFNPQTTVPDTHAEYPIWIRYTSHTTISYVARNRGAAVFVLARILYALNLEIRQLASASYVQYPINYQLLSVHMQNQQRLKNLTALHVQLLYHMTVLSAYTPLFEQHAQICDPDYLLKEYGLSAEQTMNVGSFLTGISALIQLQNVLVDNVSGLIANGIRLLLHDYCYLPAAQIFFQLREDQYWDQETTRKYAIECARHPHCNYIVQRMYLQLYWRTHVDVVFLADVSRIFNLLLDPLQQECKFNELFLARYGLS